MRDILTALSPSFCTLLKLEEYVAPVIRVLEMVHVIKH